MQNLIGILYLVQIESIVNFGKSEFLLIISNNSKVVTAHVESILVKKSSFFASLRLFL